MQTTILPNPGTTQRTGRLVSLDAFRGFTIAAMIIVNDPGSWDQVYAPLLHAHWHGITPTDCVFPFFVFMVGVSIALSYTRQKQQQAPRRRMVLKILSRSLLIYGIGIFLSLYPTFDFSTIRFAGVLPRIALVFLFCALLFLYSDWKTQAVVGAGLLIAYWLMMTLIPVPGLGFPALEPGKNLAAWIDSQFLPGRKWQGTWDPEGILSTLPAFATGISGMLAGRLILSGQSQERKIIWLFTLGLGAFVLGSMWNWIFPINKNLWTSSFVLYTSGLAAMILAAFIWLVDVQGYRSWTKAGVVFGSNAIAAYALADLLIPLLFSPIGSSGQTVNGWFFGGLVGAGLAPKFVSFLWALAYCGLCFIPIWILYRKKWFIKV